MQLESESIVQSCFQDLAVSVVLASETNERMGVQESSCSFLHVSGPHPISLQLIAKGGKGIKFGEMNGAN